MSTGVLKTGRLTARGIYFNSQKSQSTESSRCVETGLGPGFLAVSSLHER
ncbi:hypothetical protein HCBG_03730 [Histoplasma capsulatum G186AR]|uniref:Uncharacterized protein n=2 Tax=Ajellomyces capsulatus TaxID=5037 RepID=C0NKQ0_AJECG|nr:uncharacterized protein HCBG_03730 [Histoplasma capsulatum G186AR]EEH08441.1 hypothetical protein HCBG_03730 [Histoplasma capsulatum G186AR]